MNVICYVVGYGRSASTLLGTEISKKYGLHFLGEVKYLFNNKKDDLLDEKWMNYKKGLRKFDRNIIRIKDSIFGIFLIPFFNDLYARVHKDIFLTDISYCDTSKTTLDSILRPYNLKINTCHKIIMLTYPRPLNEVIHSILKGKNSHIERGEPTIHISKLISICHLFITRIIIKIFFKNVQFVNINNVEALNLNIELSDGSFINNIIYGNRSRKN